VYTRTNLHLEAEHAVFLISRSNHKRHERIAARAKDLRDVTRELNMMERAKQ
jgi:hypothetical protein